ncbi:uncharacterized protein BX664DRAFT_377996 [Halteromyces radiatus]|uniref:uncharacterized protein n=1 Tax=Halteromyces radiatus TaxID=101107 RepID=UPI00221FE415|nr:uncharacterized protein BX664DRAFT_377996 [Halteromyces radiatus]KAI8096873.1 hypothetical protein BX664DRAFT_377996 [Halteromyces radiatus]
MFKKPVTSLKSFSALRSSDRRRFQTEAYDAYPELKEQCTQQNIHVMPDTLQAAKFVSHIERPGIIYKADGKPTWFKTLDSPPIPTVYTLWRYPTILPTLYTWGPVVQKLIEGADLMIPGLVNGPDGTLPSVKEGDLVAITIRGYKYPLAVGKMAISSSDIKVRSGMKGKAVYVLHVYHDFLWAMGDKSEPPEMKDISDDEYMEEEDENDNQQQDDNQTTVEEIQQSSQVSTTMKEDTSMNYTTSEIDDLLKESLYQGLLFKLTPEKGTSVLPISASSLYTAYILPSRPRRGGLEVDIKKSSWKKVQKFLKTMEKTGLLKLKEQRGETNVTTINWSHPSLQGVTPYKTVEKLMLEQQQQQQHLSTPSSIENQPTGKSNTISADTSSSDQIQILDMYKPIGSTIPLFELTKNDKTALYSSVEVRQIILEYIKAENLVDSKNQRMINMNPILTDAILNKSEYQTVNQLGRDQIVQRLLSKMQPFHLVTLPGKEPILRKGIPKEIEVTQEIRQGRKTVTKLTGMESFGLEIDDLCKELTKLCASSATHNQIHGTSPKAPLYEIMVQGPQMKHVSELLLRKGVPKKLIMVNDKTAKKGKGKK